MADPLQASSPLRQGEQSACRRAWRHEKRPCIGTPAEFYLLTKRDRRISEPSMPRCGARLGVAALSPGRQRGTGVKWRNQEREPAPGCGTHLLRFVKLKITGLKGHVNDELGSGDAIGGLAMIRLGGWQKRAGGP
jgi:hypothetical protein